MISRLRVQAAYTDIMHDAGDTANPIPGAGSVYKVNCGDDSRHQGGL